MNKSLLIGIGLFALLVINQPRTEWDDGAVDAFIKLIQ